MLTSRVSMRSLLAVVIPLCTFAGSAVTYGWKALDARYVHESAYRAHLLADSINQAADARIHEESRRRRAIDEFVIDSLRHRGDRGHVLQAGAPR